MSLLSVDINPQGIATVKLNRPEKRNAMTFALLHALVDTAKSLKKNIKVPTISI